MEVISMFSKLCLSTLLPNSFAHTSSTDHQLVVECVKLSYLLLSTWQSVLESAVIHLVKDVIYSPHASGNVTDVA